MNKVNSTKPTSTILRKAAKAPQAYRPQPTPKCLQLKAGPITNPAQAKTQGPAAPPAYRPQPVPKVLQRKMAPVQPSAQSSLRHSVAPSRASRVVQRMEVTRKDQQVMSTVWSQYTNIMMPSRKHLLEKMTLNDANGKKKVSVVRESKAETAVEEIQKHVKEHGWESSDTIKIEWNDDYQCYQVTYDGNVWMTHSNGGQLWPLRGKDIFSPPEGLNVKKFITQWRSGKVPGQYMNM